MAILNVKVKKHEKSEYESVLLVYNFIEEFNYHQFKIIDNSTSIIFKTGDTNPDSVMQSCVEFLNENFSSYDFIGEIELEVDIINMLNKLRGK